MHGALPKPKKKVTVTLIIAENFHNMAKYGVFFIFLILPVLFSCAGISAGMSAAQPPQERITPIPEKPELVFIMGEGKADGETLAVFLLQNNPFLNPDYARMLASHYVNEAAFEGINHDVAFSQMCLETGYLSYGGLVQPEWNNFCGLGAIGPEQPGLIFPDPQTGVRAHIQHLKAYATEEPLNGELVDPRYRYVRKGSSPTIDGLSGTWAADKSYSVKINAILMRLNEFLF